MKRLRWIVFILICSGSVIPLLYAQSRSELQLGSMVSQQRLQQTVHDLVKCGNRLGGTKSGDNAAAVLMDRLKSYGFKPEMIADPQKLTYSNDHWHLQIEQPKRLGGLIQHEWLAGYSPSAKQESLRLSFVQSPHDIDEDSIGKGAVLIDQHPSKNLYEKLTDAGARCILSYVAMHSMAYSNWAMISTLNESDKNPVPVFNISNLAGQRLREELGHGTTVSITYSCKTTIVPGKPKTVIATLQGQADEYYIVCAHGDSDSGGPGADDNASGESGVLELARIFKLLMKKNNLPPPKYSIRFILWGSEYFSASSYIKLHEKELKKIRGVINFDEIGIGKTRNCLYFEGNDVPQNDDLLRLFERVGEEFVGKKGFWKESTTNPSQGGTDSYVFLPKYLDYLDVPEVKIPSITVFTAAWNEPKTMRQTRGWSSKAWKGNPDSVTLDYSPYYHSSLDIPVFTTDREPANMIWGVKAVGIALLRLLW
ncbi:MAG: Zn-dependent exopeptidase M28 [Ignavibacteriae bacterium]|nr:MAG: Zn-dependent exopeptidase M28 [Ignavibacteriota bacterium]